MRLRCTHRKATENPLHSISNGVAVARETIKLVLLCLVLSCHTALSASATRDEVITNHTAVYPINLPAQSVADSLASLSEQLDLLLLIPYQTATNLQANPVRGNFTLTQALDLILQGTGFSAGLTDRGVITISQNGSASRINQNGKGKSMNTTNSSKRKTLLAGLVGLFAAGGMTQAVAQGGEAATGQSAIDEIIVTANKREQRLQDTALSISALTGETISKRGLVGMEDYLPSIPGVSMQDRGVSQNNIIIRGIASDPQIETSNVGVYFGEIPLANLGSASSSDLSGSADLKLVDIERIEVLRGPQGTLYGSGSMGGTVRAIPKSPNLEQLEGSFNGRYSNTGERGGDNSMVQGVINIPLIEDKLAVRAVAYRFDNSGFIDNVAGSDSSTQTTYANHIALGAVAVDESDIGSNETTGFRISALWQATDSLSFTLTHIQQELEQKGLPEVNLNLDDEFQQIRLKAGLGDNREFLNNELDVTNLVIEYDLGWGDLLSTSTWIDYESNQDADISFVFPYPVSQGGEKETDVFAQELRFSSKFDGPLQLLAGLYYEDIDPPQTITARWSGDPALDVNSVGIQTFFERKQTKQKAFFGELSYQLTEQVIATLGVRHFDYEAGISKYYSWWIFLFCL